MVDCGLIIVVKELPTGHDPTILLLCAAFSGLNRGVTGASQHIPVIVTKKQKALALIRVSANCQIHHGAEGFAIDVKQIVADADNRIINGGECQNFGAV